MKWKDTLQRDMSHEMEGLWHVTLHEMEGVYSVVPYETEG